MIIGLLTIGLLTVQSTSTFTADEPGLAKPKPVFMLTLSATIAPSPDIKTLIPVVPMRAMVIYRDKKITLLDPKNFQRALEPVAPFNLTPASPEIPAGTKIPLPLLSEQEALNGNLDAPSRTPLKTFLRLSGQDTFNDGGFMTEHILIHRENNCMIENAQATCSLRIPSVQIQSSDSPTTKTIEVKIFRQGSFLKDNLSKNGVTYISIKPTEQIEDYIRKFTRPDLTDPRRKANSNLTNDDLLEIDGTTYGYIFYSKLTFSAELPEMDMPVEVPEEPYAIKNFQYSRKQSVGRIPLLPGHYWLERTIESIDDKGQSKIQRQFTTVDLSKWGEFVSADDIEWKDLSAIDKQLPHDALQTPASKPIEP